MSFRTLHLVDSELRPMAEMLSSLKISADTLEQTRMMINEMSQLRDDLPPTVIRSEIEIPTRDGFKTRALKYVHRDKLGEKSKPCLVHIHGGGLVMGKPEINDGRHIELCEKYGLTIIAPSYRVAPEHPYPTPLYDSLDAWTWVHENADDMGLDTSRIALSGDSAGGCLAAAVSQSVRDHGGGSIAHLLLLYPMLDAKTGTDESALDPILGEFGWTPEMNRFGWSAYLAGANPVAPANPAAIESVENLPSCWIGVGSLDLFLDEDINYARRLITAGVSTELKIYPAAVHGFPIVEDAFVSKNFVYDYSSSLANALALGGN